MGNKSIKSRLKARYIANAAMLTALCVVILSFGTIIETMDLSFAAISALVLWISLLEFGKKTAWSVYFATAALSFLLLPSKFPSVFFVFITGWYPMIKLSLSKRIKNKGFLWFIKLVVFNIAAAISVCFIYIFASFLGVDSNDSLTKIYMISMFATSNFAFIITDILMDKLVIVYIYKIRDKLKKMKLID